MLAWGNIKMVDEWGHFIRWDTEFTLVNAKGRVKQKRFKDIKMTVAMAETVGDLNGWKT